MLLTPMVFPHLCQVIHKTVPKKKNLGKNVLKLDIFASLLLHHDSHKRPTAKVESVPLESSHSAQPGPP